MRSGEILHLEWDKDNVTNAGSGYVDFLQGIIHLKNGVTKNKRGRDVPLIPELRASLVARRAQRQDCGWVCYKVDKSKRTVRIKGFRKAWINRCAKAGLGKFKPMLDADGKQMYAAPRSENSKPVAKMVYEGKKFHDLRRSGARALLHAGVPEKVIMAIGGWKTRSVFYRYSIVVQSDVFEAGKKLTAYHAENVGHNSGAVVLQDAAVESLKH
jgi:integrase